LKSDFFYIAHILECVERIGTYCAGGEAEFFASEMVQDAVLRNLQVLAESSQRVSEELKARYSRVDWRGLSGFRNVVVHDYLGINTARIWHIVSVDLAELKRQMLEISNELGRSAT
jgi:uncharacterized protein with HEPN domain